MKSRSMYYLFCLFQMFLLAQSLPLESCLVSAQCNSYCQSHGYTRAMCRTRLQYGSITPLRRYCHCSHCDSEHCQRHCSRIARKYAGCSCFSFAQRNPSLPQRNENAFANECNENVLYCQSRENPYFQSHRPCSNSLDVIFSMDQILPGLFIGSFRDAKDECQLRANCITHILAIHDTARCDSSQAIDYLCITASDTPGQNLSQFFSRCNDFIHSARLAHGNILIHCLAGVSRSVTILLAYLITVTKLSLKQVADAVRSVRSISNPNPGFYRQLQHYELYKLKKERQRMLSKFPGTILATTEEEQLKQLLKLRI